MSPQLRPLEQWVCDECGEIIQEPKHGYVEWLSGFATGEGPHGFRIVHHAPRSPQQPHGNCYRYSRSPGRQDLPVTDFLGESGIPLILSLIDVGRYHDPDRKARPAKDAREWADLYRRLHLPYFEEARRHWDRASRDGYFAEANELWVYMPNNMRARIEHYEREDWGS